MSIYASWLDLDDNPPLIYQGSHVNPADDDPRGGDVDIAAIPDHCHPSVRGTGEDGPPVEFLRLSVTEHDDTYGERQPGSGTVVLNRRHAEEIRDLLTTWLDRSEDNDGQHSYLSTACWHAQHGDPALHTSCRNRCKFCPGCCSCPCHGEAGTQPATGSPVDQARDIARELWAVAERLILPAGLRDRVSGDPALFWLRGEEQPPGEWKPEEEA